MNSIRLVFALSSVALALGGCGGANDASDDAVADSVEVPADEAMANVPMPVEDANASNDVADEPDTVDEVESDAERAANDAQAAVDDVISAAEEKIESN